MVIPLNIITPASPLHSCASAGEERDQKQNDEHNQADFRDRCSNARQSTESQHTGNQSDHQKHNCPAQHSLTLSRLRYQYRRVSSVSQRDSAFHHSAYGQYRVPAHSPEVHYRADSTARIEWRIELLVRKRRTKQTTIYSFNFC